MAGAHQPQGPERLLGTTRQGSCSCHDDPRSTAADVVRGRGKDMNSKGC